MARIGEYDDRQAGECFDRTGPVDDANLISWRQGIGSEVVDYEYDQITNGD